MCKSCEWQKTAEKITEALSDLDDLPDRATEYREGVEPKLSSMLEWIEKNKHVTPPMVTTIDNMCSGIDKWLGRE